MDAKDISNLRLCLQDPVPQIRQSALVRVVKEQVVQVLDSVMEMADTDPDPKLRYYAKKGIQVLREARASREKSEAPSSGQTAGPQTGSGAVGDQSPEDGTRSQRIKLVLSHLAALDPQKRALAIKAAVALEGAELMVPMAEMLEKETDRFNLSQIITYLGKRGTALARAWKEQGRWTDPQGNPIQSDRIGTLGPPHRLAERVSALIIPFLESEDARIRANSVEALELLGDSQSLKHIFPLLQDPDNRCRGNAISALRNHGEANIFNHLQEMICSDKVWMQDSAAFVLGMINSSNSLMLLGEALSSRHHVVRAQARKSIEKLAQGGNSQAASMLKNLNPDNQDFSESAMALFEDLASEVENTVPLSSITRQSVAREQGPDQGVTHSALATMRVPRRDSISGEDLLQARQAGLLRQCHRVSRSSLSSISLARGKKSSQVPEAPVHRLSPAALGQDLIFCSRDRLTGSTLDLGPAGLKSSSLNLPLVFSARSAVEKELPDISLTLMPAAHKSVPGKNLSLGLFNRITT